MKLQLDTKSKVITVEESVNLKELVDFIQKILPNGAWKEYKLQSAVINNWSYPIYIDRWHPAPFYPSNPIWLSSGTATYANPPLTTTTASYQSQSWIFCLETN